MPLVGTLMTGGAKIYNNVPTLSLEDAADMIAQARVFQPVRVATRLGINGQRMHALVPHVAQITWNTSFRMSGDSPQPRAARMQNRGSPPARWHCSR